MQLQGTCQGNYKKPGGLDDIKRNDGIIGTKPLLPLKTDYTFILLGGRGALKKSVHSGIIYQESRIRFYKSLLKTYSIKINFCAKKQFL